MLIALRKHVRNGTGAAMRVRRLHMYPRRGKSRCGISRARPNSFAKNGRFLSFGATRSSREPAVPGRCARRPIRPRFIFRWQM